jgi:hypothetical protein
MGTTMIPEEFYFVGFLPLQSFIDLKKSIGSGMKCPPEKEVLVRSLLIKDHLESLRCTLEELKRNSSSPREDQLPLMT